MYTLAQLKLACQHAAGGIATPASGSSWEDVVKDSIRHITCMHAWTWRERLMLLDLAADQEVVDLPDNFGQLVSLARTDKITACRRVSLSRINELRSYPIAIEVGVMLYCVTGDNVPYTLEIYPTPTATVTGALRGVYLRGPEYPATDSDTVSMPESFGTALKALCRAWAKGEELDSDGTDATKFRDCITAAIAEESGIENDLGMMDNTLASPALPVQWLRPSHINVT